MGNRNILLAASAALAIAAAAPAAQAAVLAPGATATAPDVLPFGFGTLLPGGSITGSFTSSAGAGDYTGTYTDKVFSDPANTFAPGDLTFYLTVTNTGTAGVTNNIDRITESSFTGFLTDVGFLGPPFNTGTAPNTVDRLTAPVVGFNITLTPGSTTDTLTIMTNATNFTTGTVSFINGGVASVSGFAPTAIPEPSTWAMLLLGFASLGYAGFRGRKTAISIA